MKPNLSMFLPSTSLAFLSHTWHNYADGRWFDQSLYVQWHPTDSNSPCDNNGHTTAHSTEPYHHLSSYIQNTYGRLLNENMSQ